MNEPLDPPESYYFLFVLLPRWEEHGTICHDCFPNGSRVTDICLCPRPWVTDTTNTISSETAYGN